MNILDRSNEDLSDRNQKIVKDYRSGGGSLRDLAVRYELSKSQIGDIIKNGSQFVDDADSLPF